jgi:hypothetical protein
MKTSDSCKILAAVLLMGATASLSAIPAIADDSGPASAAAVQPENSGQLWIAVHLTQGTSPTWVGDDMADTFADTIAKSLRAQGLKGNIGTLRPEDAIPDQAPVLVVRLTTWTANQGLANCTFTASLRTREGERDLGIFSGDNLVVTSDGAHRSSSDGLMGSAREAMNGLYSRLRATRLLAAD